ncbi:LysE family translocator [Streptomyces profundus]|uniref:LysE family translocator n=1 Tax=Streptomyces profundus TaxID=2867410 RepID=UPI001D162116|nr:LysE family translocator [Streptomyces sp. MA3_2.13]UED83215.1 LysE family translocator [Streptomyces sp. MA3_2.13]
MPQPATLWWFFTASLILLLVPGPSVLYVTGRTFDQGLSAGTLSTVGLALGDLVQVLAAVVGLSALIASSEVAFEIVKYAGAAYLLWLGVQRLRTPAVASDPEDGTSAPSPGRRVLLQGLVVNALNPKSTLFFLAFLPVFVKSADGPVWSQTLVLGLVFVAVGMVTNASWALLSLLIRGRVRQSRGFLQVQRYVGGGVFLVLAGAVLTTGSAGD